MLNKFVAFLLSCVIVMFSHSPSKVLAQTQIKVRSADEQRLTTAQAKPKPDLRKFFAKEMAKTKSDALTEADFKRMEKERLFPGANAQAKKKDRTTLALVLVGVAITVGVILLVKYGADNPTPFCADVPSAPNCIP